MISKSSKTRIRHPSTRATAVHRRLALSTATASSCTSARWAPRASTPGPVVFSGKTAGSRSIVRTARAVRWCKWHRSSPQPVLCAGWCSCWVRFGCENAVAQARKRAEPGVESHQLDFRREGEGSEVGVLPEFRCFVCPGWPCASSMKFFCSLNVLREFDAQRRIVSLVDASGADEVGWKQKPAAVFRHGVAGKRVVAFWISDGRGRRRRHRGRGRRPRHR
jgi:hypothetical protein